MKQEIPTPTSIRKAYVEEYLKRRPDAEEFARFTESELADFIRKHESPNFESIYTQLDHNYYDRVRHDMAIDGQMRTEDNAADNRYSLHLKTWSGFLESKAFRNLFKTKIAIEDLSSDAEPSVLSTPSFREETEGERKHILKEMDVIRRNPQGHNLIIKHLRDHITQLRTAAIFQICLKLSSVHKNTSHINAKRPLHRKYCTLLRKILYCIATKKATKKLPIGGLG